jgi:hypothetical protein
VLAKQAQEEGGGVHRPVVARQRRELPRGELACTQLVDHLAGLLVVLVVDLRAEPTGEQPQRLLGHFRVEREHLKRRDDAVAPEQRRVPGHAGGVVALAVEAGGEQPKVQ